MVSRWWVIHTDIEELMLIEVLPFPTGGFEGGPEHNFQIVHKEKTWRIPHGKSLWARPENLCELNVCVTNIMIFQGGALGR